MSSARFEWPLLLIEDDEATARCIARLLEPFGPTHAIGGFRKGLSAVMAGRWAGVLLDIGLPDGCGLDLAVEIRRSEPALPMMMLTASATPAHINRAASLGLRLACKPCGIQELKPLVDEAIRGGERATAAARAVSVAHERWGLTRREREILAAAVSGTSPSDYRRAAGISENTYKGYVRSLLLKSDSLRLASLAVDALREAIR